jgi:hypothetical protein
MTQDQPPEQQQRGIWRTGYRFGSIGCVGCATFVVLAIVVVIVLLAMAGSQVH